MGWKVHRIRPAIWMKAHSVGTKGERSTTEWKNVLKSRAAMEKEFLSRMRAARSADGQEGTPSRIYAEEFVQARH